MDVERIFHDEESVRRFIAKMGEARQVTACYEAGPTGPELQRLLQRLQIPSKFPDARVHAWGTRKGSRDPDS